MLAERLAPANVEAEESVIGSLLIDSSGVSRVAATLRADDFSRPAHAHIYQAIIDLYARHQAIDFLTVTSELQRVGKLTEIGGQAYLTALITHTPTSAHVEHYAALVERDAVRRRLMSAANEIAEIAFVGEKETIQELIDRAEELLFRVSEQRLHRDLVPIQQLVAEYHEKIEEIRENRDLALGVRTGFAALDMVLGGLQGSDLCIVAGRPGTGKTSWLLTVAADVARRGGTVAVFSLEMSGEQLLQRLIASRTGISSQQLRMGQIRTEREFDMIVRAIADLSEMPMYVDDTPGITPFELRTKVRRLHAECGVDLVLVDYLQLMQGGSRTENRVQEISLISRSLKSLARELEVPVIAASQLSRAVEGRKDKHPQLADLRESGSIEQDADIVMFLYREELYNKHTDRQNITEVDVAKHRHGPTQSIDLVFVAHETRFRDVERPRQPVPVDEVPPGW
jgi:replicative DNA helicase